MLAAQRRRELHVMVARMAAIRVFRPFEALKLQVVAVDGNGVGCGAAGGHLFS
ncbi:hypothetical protein ACKI14_02830 [Streptomyces turgidiscabies]|uniref:hypothetical protein n=1 Tax=Streptomyces turgidiscabies TaxID=85558 RepID=UPI0038F71AB6